VQMKDNCRIGPKEEGESPLSSEASPQTAKPLPSVVINRSCTRPALKDGSKAERTLKRPWTGSALQRACSLSTGVYAGAEPAPPPRWEGSRGIGSEKLDSNLKIPFAQRILTGDNGSQPSSGGPPGGAADRKPTAGSDLPLRAQKPLTFSPNGVRIETATDHLQGLSWPTLCRSRGSVSCLFRTRTK